MARVRAEEKSPEHVAMLIFDGACVWKRGALSAHPRLSQADRSGSGCSCLSLLAALAPGDDTLSLVREPSVSAKGRQHLAQDAVLLFWAAENSETQGYALSL